MERSLLQSQIIPELKKYCLAKSWQFECIDLRWGISEEAQEYRKTIEICLNEIRHCRNVSPKPNFIVLLGQRYGWVPAPTEITKEDFSILLTNLDERNATILNQYYQDDGTKFVLCDNAEDSLVAKILKVATIGDVYLSQKYYISATEIEIYEGLLSQKDLASNTILYDRNLIDIPINRYCDFIEDPTADNLKTLKKKIYAFVSQENILQENLRFDDYESERFKMSFVDKMTSKLRNLIDNEINEYLDMDDYQIEHLFQESILQTDFNGIFPRKLLEIESTKSKIVVIKTSDEFKRRTILSEYARSHQENSFFRSLGRSWMSSDGIGFLKSFLKTYNIHFLPSDSFKKLVERFRSFFRFPNYYNVSPPNYIIIDSFDHLSSTDLFLYFTWFLYVNHNTRVILSLSDTQYLSYLNPIDYEIIEIESDYNFKYSDFEKKFNFICSPENNNYLFVSLVVGLICYSHSGVTEDEILEITAMDQQYYSHLLATSKHDLPIIENLMLRIPYSIWSILYYHMGHMLVMRNSLGATTFVFDDEEYKEYAIRFFGEEMKPKIYNLIIKYFTTPIAYNSTRALDELPYAYLALDAYDELYKLLQDNSFCQRLIVNGLSEKLFDYITILKQEFKSNIEILSYLDCLFSFLTMEIDKLCKYAKYDKTFFQKEFKTYLTKELEKNSPLYYQKVIFLRNCTSASRIQAGLALIVSYEQNRESLCEIIDLETGSLVAMRHIELDLIIKGNHSYLGYIEKSYIEKSIVYLYDNHGYLNIWDYSKNSLNRVQCGYLDIIPQDNTVDFLLPKDFKLENNEQIISYGYVDSNSFYVVTCSSLQLIVKTK